MAGKKRGVNIERGEGGHRENLFVKELPVARNHQDVGTLGLKSANEGAIASRSRLQHGYPLIISEGGDSASLDRAPATSREVRARHDKREFVPAPCHRV